MTPPPALPDASDQDLVAWARQGRLDAFDELVRRHHRSVYGLVYRMVRDHDLADDLTQDAFVKAFRELKRYRGDGKFSSWLLKIANNLALDDFRRVRREPETVPLEPTPDATDPRRLAAGVRRGLWSTSAPTPRDLQPLAPALEEALGRLDEKDRECFIKRKLESRSYEDIGELLNLPVGSVATRVHRARRQLHAALGPLYETLMDSSLPPA